MSGSRVCCVVLAVLVAGSTAAATPSGASARGILTPRPHSAHQLGPPTATPAPTMASSETSSGTLRKSYEEVDEAQQLGGEPSLIRTITTQVRLFLACVPRWGPVACLKLEALLLLHGEAGDTTMEGFVDGPDSESRHGSFFAELSERPEARDAYLNRMLLQALEDLVEDVLGLSRDHAERGMRRRRRWPNPLLAVMFGLGSLVVVGGIAKTAMIAGKALALSLLALALAVMMGLRGGAGGGAGGGAANYEILATGLRRRSGVVSTASSQFPSAVYLEPGPEQPSALGALGGQSLAYSGHHTRP